MLFLLRQLVAKKCLVSVSPDGGNPSALLALLEVDEAAGTLTFDVAGSAALNARLIRAGKLVCETQLDRVQIRFQLNGPMRNVEFEGGPALAAVIPEAVLRLQRREHYRINTPIAQPLRCFIPLPPTEEGMPMKAFEVRVLDISGGGVAIAAPPGGMFFSMGAEIDGCRIELPDPPVIVTRIAVRNIFRVTQMNGIEQVRAGCQFVSLTPGQESAIQRYILRLERERASRGS